MHPPYHFFDWVMHPNVLHFPILYGIWHIDTSLSIVHVILIKMSHSELDFLFNMFVVCSFLLELKEMGWNLMLPNV
jgi:hypothetical protein